MGLFGKSKQDAVKSLKLAAQDADSLQIISGLMQDATCLKSDMHYDAHSKHFVMMTNRFRWEEKKSFFKPAGKRIRTALQFNQITAVQFKGLSDEHIPYSLLAIDMHDSPETRDEAHDWAREGHTATHHLHLCFSGGHMIKLHCDGVAVILTDMGEDWDATKRPIINKHSQIPM